jgi:hypothetical protein
MDTENEKSIFCAKSMIGRPGEILSSPNLTLNDLRNKLAQDFQVDHLNFLIGAGCSSYREKDIKANQMKEKSIPTMYELFKRFCNEHEDFSIGAVRTNGRFHDNLEEMIEAMLAVQVVDNTINTNLGQEQTFNKIDIQIDKKLRIVQNFIREQIKNGMVVSNVDGNKEYSPVLSLYEEFYQKIAQRSRENPINIFTTNYDLFNELALDTLGFPYNNGFTGAYKRKFNPLSYHYMYVENLNLHDTVWQKVSNFFNLVKLHGSISWVREKEEILEKNYEEIGADETVMIYPTPLKDRSTLMVPYSDLFRMMENQLALRNSLLIVLGYSFSDDHINRVIFNGFRSPSFRLVVFGDPESNKGIMKLLKLGDPRISVIYSKDKENKIHYFKNFVEKALPDITPDIKESVETKSSSELIGQFERVERSE